MENGDEILCRLRFLFPASQNFFNDDPWIFFIESVEDQLFHAVIQETHILEQLLKHLSNNLGMLTWVFLRKYLLEELLHEGLFEWLLLRWR